MIVLTCLFQESFFQILKDFPQREKTYKKKIAKVQFDHRKSVKMRDQQPYRIHCFSGSQTSDSISKQQVATKSRRLDYESSFE